MVMFVSDAHLSIPHLLPLQNQSLREQGQCLISPVDFAVVILEL